MSGSELLTRMQTFKREPVEIEGGGTFYVREVSAAEAADYAKRHAAPDKDDLENTAWLAVRVLCDADGKPLLAGEDAAEQVKALPVRVLKTISETAARVSGWAKGDDDSKKNDAGS